MGGRPALNPYYKYGIRTDKGWLGVGAKEGSARHAYICCSCDLKSCEGTLNAFGRYVKELHPEIGPMRIEEWTPDK